MYFSDTTAAILNIPIQAGRNERMKTMKKLFTAICFSAAILTLTACTDTTSDSIQTTDALQHTAVKTEIPANTDQNLKSDFEIEDVDGGIRITKYKGSGGNVQIPEAIGGKSVIEIDDAAFGRCSDITSVSLPDSITAIGSYAFVWCINLASINIPSGVTLIGMCAFSGCTSLTEIYIPASVTYIGKTAFYGCTELNNISVASDSGEYCSVDGVLFNKDKTVLYTYPLGKPDKTYAVPDTVTELYESAFDGCTSLTGITLPNGLEIIGDYALLGCSSLTDINIPDSVTKIGDLNFYKNENIQITYKGKTYLDDELDNLFAAINH